MNSLRESLSSIPGSLSTYLPENPISSYLNTTNTTSSSSSTDLTVESSERETSWISKAQAIPNSLIKEEWQLVLGQNPAISDLETAIDGTKKLIANSEEMSLERKWLVRHLIELRFRLKELQESNNPVDDGVSEIKVILGHHFSVRQTRNNLPTRNYCDHCTGIIWSVVQSSYNCLDCNYIVHHKCVESVKRICAHIIVSERNYPIDEICPEIGLAAQKYKCAECKTPLNFRSSPLRIVSCFGNSKQENYWIEPRLCDYSGLFYCPSCHWNDSVIIPARVMFNWDFSSRQVCRASLQEINLILDKPIINLEILNPKLFVFLEKLSSAKRKREQLNFMKKYLSECRIAIDSKIIECNIGNRRHLIQNAEYYSINDLIDCESLILNEFLNKIFQEFEKHIRNCEICCGKGYICEICDNDEILFPFDDTSVYCECNAIFHRICWTRKTGECSKCARIEERKMLAVVKEVLDGENK